ncbi:LacI family DNA-binding transcriptional regulator [Nonomuraea sp. K274]|uniref:LacI family DNA-binding transcriptional regulator n=1 Tax=Nonomuraea cypriaca TaxID=1187855 RepID=A0A931F6V0_9ACTN|nr:LacI family DNA-binding transcriptional regulator [Nonomuraea cypriaca]MBF8193658.1 LacI family DNA-binding transcriptional regulator [Nonomuraea cypriaca]
MTSAQHAPRVPPAAGRAGRRGTATLRDVAELAGVSIRTVSNVVNASVPVREPTRRRVEDAIATLGYRPNVAARRLRSGRAQAIGLAVPDVTVPYFRELADAVLAAARERGMAVVVEQTHGDLERERAAPLSPRLRHVDGVILVAVSLAEADFMAMRGPAPVVLAGASADSGVIDSVTPDEYAAGLSVARHLLATGRRRPAVILPGDTRWPPEHDGRYRGFVAGLAEVGIALPAGRVIAAEAVTPGSGADAARELRLDRPEFDALYALGDALALGALRALHTAGLSVPGDVAVVGFGDIEQSAHSNPTLTTVNPGREAIAEQSVALIAWRMESPAARQAPPRRLTVGFRLVERESTRVRG